MAVRFKKPKIPTRMRKPSYTQAKVGFGEWTIKLTTQTDDGLSYLRKNVEGAKKVVAVTAANMLAYIAIDLLSYSLPRTPVDTGQLRQSGTAVVSYSSGGYSLVGTGNKDGTVSTNYGAIDRSAAKNSYRMYSAVHFTRYNEENENIAFKMHEQISPHGGPSPAARTPGTGPKYLEAPFLERMPHYRKLMTEVYLRKTMSSIKELSRAVRKGRGKHTVDNVVLVHKDTEVGTWR